MQSRELGQCTCQPDFRLGSSPHCSSIDPKGLSCLVMASPKAVYQICDVGKLQEALEAGSDPNSTDGHSNMTCLMAALRRNRTQMVSLLLSHPEIKINAKNRNGLTALHFACCWGSPESVKLLLAVPGLELNERTNNWGETPVMVAIKRRNTEAVRALTQKTGVDLDLKSPSGRTLEELALW